ncbi:MAG: hypothetical protein IT208_12795 [Chthonomonadales bacterium]|nr:hypothetical protein [Chthonomonadales bacterium]
MRWMWPILLLFAVASPAAARAPAADEIVAVGEGAAALGADPAAAEEEAIWEAKRSVVEQAAGIFLRARSVGRDFELVEDEVQARAAGFIRSWEVVPGSRRVEALGGARLLRLSVRARVALLPVIRRLADVADVYADLERPRLRVDAGQGAAAAEARAALTAALRADGYEVATSGPAEITVEVRLWSTPTVRLGDRSAPSGVGEVVAACRTAIAVRLVSEASEEALLAARADGVGFSFESDAEAARLSARDAAGRLLAANEALFAESLLVRWARERQEGHVVAVRASGLDAHALALLRRQVRAMRGYRRMLSEQWAVGAVTLRFVTTLDTRAVRRRLSAARGAGLRLVVRNDRGPLILCERAGSRQVSRR